MHRALVLVPLVSLLSSCAYFQQVFHVAPAAHPLRAVIVSLDGGGQQVIDHMVADGAMPNLEKLRARGVTAAYSRTNFPSKTSAGHAALWTGGYGDTNGITSNKVLQLPLNEHTILETADGFDSSQLLSEPIWVTAARSGKRAIVFQATHVAPLSTYGEDGRFGGPLSGTLSLMDGYGGIDGKEGIYTDPNDWVGRPPRPGQAPNGAGIRAVDLKLGTLWATPYDDGHGEHGLNTVDIGSVASGTPLATLKPGNGPQSWSKPITVQTPTGPATCEFHLFALALDGSSWLLYHTPLCHVLNNNPPMVNALYGPFPFVPQGAVELWKHGELGPTLFHGGDGLAESRYLETVDHFLGDTAERTRLLAARRDWDLAVDYVPFPDEALHAWYGAVDPNSPSYDPALAPTVWKLLDRVGSDCDRVIGTLAADPNTIVAVTSDHGFAGLKWKFYPNVVLRKAGLLKLFKDGSVDLAHTQAFYPATDGAFIVVNHEGHKGGWVPRAKVNAVLARVEAALKAVRATDGTALVTGFVQPGVDDRLPSIPVAGTPGVYDELGIGGIRGGDLYLDLHPGYNFSPDFHGSALTSPYEPGTGGHVFDPRRPDMHASFAIAGPGIQRGVRIGPVRNIDVAPTIARLLGIPAPARATGRVLEEALAVKS